MNASPGQSRTVSNALSTTVFPQPFAQTGTTLHGAINPLLSHYPKGGFQPMVHRLDRKTLNFLFQATSDPAAPMGHGAGAGSYAEPGGRPMEEVYIPDGTYPGGRRAYNIPTRMAHLRRAASMDPTLVGPADAVGAATVGPPLINSDIWGEGTFLEDRSNVIEPGGVRYRLSDDRDRTVGVAVAAPGTAGNALVLDSDDD